jgi:hypothetical protein
MVDMKDFNDMMRDKYNIIGMSWVAWLIVGMIFYSEVLDTSYAEGFYMAVNVGYSIGFGDIPESSTSKWFSTFYVLVGASFVGAALGVFADHITSQGMNWYALELDQRQYEVERNAATMPHMKAFLWVKHEWHNFRAVLLWFAFICFSTAFAWGLNSDNGFDFIDSLYFSVSSLSTGGLQSIPRGSPAWMYGLAGIYCAFGVPLMGLAMATVAGYFMSSRGGTIEEAKGNVMQPITEDEIAMLEGFNLADKDGVIDKSEFIILCMVRQGMQVEVISLVSAYFDDLDKDKSGTLTLDEITQKCKVKSEMHLSSIVKDATERRASLKIIVGASITQSPLNDITGTATTTDTVDTKDSVLFIDNVELAASTKYTSITNNTV